MLDVQHGPISYVALSHCWGPPSQRPPTTTTTTANLASNSRRIYSHGLSLTFEDAVKLTSDLGQRYLWIDSLCIIQGDSEDWQREASSMAKVYGNAIFTLSALSSGDSNQGCPIGDSRVMTHDRRFFDFDSGPHRIRLFEKDIVQWHEEYGDDSYRHGEYGEDPLRGRAWTLRERELSPRHIYFSHNLVLWECNTIKGSNELPWHEVEPMDDFQPWPTRAFPEESLIPDGPVTVRDQWYRLMEDYMSRQLTKATDKSPALSGLAQSFQTKLPSSQYLAGLWSGHLPQALLWQVDLDDNAQRSKTYRAPSWSFLSLDGRISYESLLLSNIGGDRPQEPLEDFTSTNVDVLESSVELIGADQYGVISQALLSIRGKLLQVSIKPQHGNDNGIESWVIFDLCKGCKSGVFFPDVAGEHSTETHMWCIGVRSEPKDSHVQMPYAISESLGSGDALVMGLALQRDATNVDTVRRIGLVRWMKRSAFAGVGLSEFVLH